MAGLEVRLEQPAKPAPARASQFKPADSAYFQIQTKKGANNNIYLSSIFQYASAMKS